MAPDDEFTDPLKLARRILFDAEVKVHEQEIDIARLVNVNATERRWISDMKDVIATLEQARKEATR